MSPARPRALPEFPDRLKAARERRGWSQAELAEKAGFQPSAISRFETEVSKPGASKPSFENLRRLARALRVSTDYLLGLSDDPLKAAAPTDPLYRKFEELTDEQREFAKKMLDDLAEMGEEEAMKASPYVWAGRLAEKLVAKWGIEVLPIDVEAIARKHEILVQPMPTAITGVSGMLQRAGDSFGIAYATFVDSKGFQRFSIAHELGHFFLDGHPEKVLSGGTHHSRAGFASGDRYELEADHFAAGLLMPNPLFARAMDQAGAGFVAIDRLSGLCRTSLTAAAIRYAENAEGPVAIVMSTGQTIDYWFASDAFKRIPRITWLRKGDPLPRTATLSFNADAERVQRGERLEASSSIAEWFGDGPDRELSEDVVGLGSYGRTLTVLFAEEWPDEDEEEDEDVGAFDLTFHRSRKK